MTKNIKLESMKMSFLKESRNVLATKIMISIILHLDLPKVF